MWYDRHGGLLLSAAVPLRQIFELLQPDAMREAAAWAGGERGREVTDRFLRSAASWLRKPGGRLLLIVLEQNDPHDVLHFSRGVGLEGRPLLSRRADEELLTVLKLWHAGSAEPS